MYQKQSKHENKKHPQPMVTPLPTPAPDLSAFQEKNNLLKK